VFVALRKTIRVTVKREFDVPESEQVFGPVLINGCPRYVAFLPHPNARGYRSFKRCIDGEKLQELRSFLRS
jgi:hypothetical protein